MYNFRKCTMGLAPTRRDVFPASRKDEINKRIKELAKKYDVEIVDIDDVAEGGLLVKNEDVPKIAASVIGIRRLIEENGCTAVAGECWSMLHNEFGIFACFAWGALTDEGIPTTCETDVLGALGSSMMAGAVRNDTIPFFADITVRHPTNDNAELLWHCGPFPYSLAKDECHPAVIDCKGQFEIQGGDITVLRWGCASGHYTVFADECKSTQGPRTNGTYLWIEVDNWPKWERKFVKGPYIHHVTGARGKYAEIIREALQYIGDIYPDSI